jgi:uncharacterized membrane protein YkgB
LFGFAERLTEPLLRISLGLVLLWIGFVDLISPETVITLLSVSLPFLASTSFVYPLKVLEIIAGIMLIAGLWVRYVALLSLALFAGTLTIFVIAPGATGFPLLNLMGQFILKDTVLASAAIALMATDATRHAAEPAQRARHSSRSEDWVSHALPHQRG